MSFSGRCSLNMVRDSRVRPMLAAQDGRERRPALASAVANLRRLDLAGRERFGPFVNGIWALANLAGAVLVLARLAVAEAPRAGTRPGGVGDGGPVVLPAWMRLEQSDSSQPIPTPTPQYVDPDAVGDLNLIPMPGQTKPR